MDEEKYGALQIQEMIRLLNVGFPLVFNWPLGRFDIEDNSADWITYSGTRCTRPPLVLPPLHQGASFGHTELMQRGLLFQRVNHVYNGFTALDCAVTQSQIEAVKFLLDGSFFRDCVRNYNPPHQHEPTLFYAVRGSNDILRVLLNDSRFDVNERGQGGMTFFLVACRLGRVAAAEMLLSLPPERHVDRFATASGGFTASFLACDNGDLPVVKLLIKYDCFRCIESGDSNIMNENSPIAAAFRAGHRNVVNYVLTLNLLTDDEIVTCMNVCLQYASFSAVCIRMALAHLKGVQRYAGQLVKVLATAVSTRQSHAVEILTETLLNCANTSWSEEFRTDVFNVYPDTESIAMGVTRKFSRG